MSIIVNNSSPNLLHLYRIIPHLRTSLRQCMGRRLHYTLQYLIRRIPHHLSTHLSLLITHILQDPHIPFRPFSQTPPVAHMEQDLVTGTQLTPLATLMDHSRMLLVSQG
jgi:hypothetical protein